MLFISYDVIGVQHTITLTFVSVLNYEFQISWKNALKRPFWTGASKGSFS
jgi:hypothetical protein